MSGGMDFISKWDANFSNHQKRQLQLIEFIERFSPNPVRGAGTGGSSAGPARLEDEFSSCGPLLAPRLLCATRRAFSCARPVDLHLRALHLLFQAGDWELYVSPEDTAGCMHVLLSVASLPPAEAANAADVQQALLVLRRMLQTQSAHALQTFAALGGLRAAAGALGASAGGGPRLTGVRRAAQGLLRAACGLCGDDPATARARGQIDPAEKKGYAGQVAGELGRLFTAPRGEAKYCALSLCRQLFAHSGQRAHLLAHAGTQWLLGALPQLTRLLVNRPIFYQYEAAAFLPELMDIPDVAAAVVQTLNGLLVLRSVVGGTSVVDSDAWKFADTPCRAPPAAGAGAGAGAGGSQGAPDPTEIAQDPTAMAIRVVAVLLDSCDSFRQELVRLQPGRFGAGLSSLLLQAGPGLRQSDSEDEDGGEFFLGDTARDPHTHAHTRSAPPLSALGGRGPSAAGAAAADSLTALLDGGGHAAMLFSLLAALLRMGENGEAPLLRKLVLLSGRPPPFGARGGEYLSGTGTGTGSGEEGDLTAAYAALPLQFHAAAQRSFMTLERFYHDGVAVSFLMLLYTLQRWLDMDGSAKTLVWGILEQFDLLKVYDHFDKEEDFEGLGDDSSDGDGGGGDPPCAESMREDDPLDLYAFCIVYLRITAEAETEAEAEESFDSQRSEQQTATEITISDNADSLVAKQRRVVRDSSGLADAAGGEGEGEGEGGGEGEDAHWSPKQSLGVAVDELRRRVGGGSLVSQLKETLFSGVAADSRDEQARAPAGGAAGAEGEGEGQQGAGAGREARERRLRDRRAQSPYSPGRPRRRAASPRGGFSSPAASAAAMAALLGPMGLRDAGPATVDSEGEAAAQRARAAAAEADHAAAKLAVSFSELLSLAMQGTNLNELKNKKGQIKTGKLKHLSSNKSNPRGGGGGGAARDNVKASSPRPASRNVSSRGTSRGGDTDTDCGGGGGGGGGRRHVNGVARRQQGDLRARLAHIRSPRPPPPPPRSPARAGPGFGSDAFAPAPCSPAGGLSRASLRRSSIKGGDSPKHKGRKEGESVRMFEDSAGQRPESKARERSMSVRFDSSDAQALAVFQHVVPAPTPPTSARGSFAPASHSRAAPPEAAFPDRERESKPEASPSPRPRGVSPRSRPRQPSSARSYKARDSPRAYSTHVAGREEGGGLSRADGRGGGGEAMWGLQAMFFGEESEHDFG
jgi:hypothetical protein